MLSNKITILIPTKDREYFLYYTLKTCINQEYKNYEVIVLDDGSTDNSIEMVKDLMKFNPHIKLHKNSDNLGMMENFEKGLNQVKDGYVMVLGGDDGLMPNSLSTINKLINDSKSPVITWPTCAFFYPGTKMKTGQLIFNIEKKGEKDQWKWIQSSEYLKRQCDNLFYVSDIETPMIYVKGIASIETIKEIKAKSPNNMFYQCSTPDGYSGIVLAGHIDKFAFYNTPLSLHGVSNTSAGVSYLKGDEKAKEVSKAFFKKANNIKLHKKMGAVNYSPLISLMTADFLLMSNDINKTSYTIDFKNLIEKAFKELQDGLFSEDNLSRELVIIYNIAIKTDNLQLFKKLLKTKRRNNRYVFEGDGFSPRQVYINANEHNVFNIFDASYFFHTTFNAKSRFKLRILFKAFFSSLKYAWASRKKMNKLSKYYVLDN
jgi:glycosyltransferase involved in cell wall biosynthesis